MTSRSTRYVLPVLTAFALWSLAVASRAEAPPTSAAILGFSDAAATAEHAREAQLDAAISPEEMRAWMQRLSVHPHHVGSPWDKSNAEWIRDLFASWGYDASISSYQVLFPTPTKRVLEMTAPTPYRAKLEEPTLAEDSTSGQKKEQLPTYNAYSIDGDVTGELVYVNQGLPRDYDELARHGIDVKGKIVLARYGGSWRGIKPKVAAEHGAIGCIIFSDPSGDGYFRGDVYPKGGWRSRDSVQRGSVADMPVYSGDPLTPGVAATADAKRLPLDQVTVLTKIPVLPISYGDAQPLLAALAGPMAPEDWRGALALPYHLGPGPAKVHLALAFDWSLKPLYDVIARIPGSELPDEWVLRGNHQDAWVNGATDPLSGLVAELAEAKAIGGMVKAGWRPQRTLVYGVWDGEEPGLLGSTEWVEEHADELRKKAVSYLNTDTIARGFFSLAGSHELERFANQVGRDVVDPETGVSVLERSRANLIAHADTPEEKARYRDRADLRIGALGSGSDYTPFLQHLGVASMNLDYGGEDQYGQYHSIYDSFDHFVRFVDPKFAYVAEAAKTAGRITLRMSEAEVLPFTLDREGEVISGYVDEVVKLADTMRAQTVERNRLLADKTLVLAADPTETYVPPPALDRVPYLDFAPLQNSAAQFAEASNAFESARAAAEKAGLSDAERQQLDDFLRHFEQRMLLDPGLPGRPWYRHAIYAPGLYTGYGVKTLPSIREAIELRHWDDANAQIQVISKLLDAARGAVEAMTTELAPAHR